MIKLKTVTLAAALIASGTSLALHKAVPRRAVNHPWPAVRTQVITACHLRPIKALAECQPIRDRISAAAARPSTIKRRAPRQLATACRRRAIKDQAGCRPIRAHRNKAPLTPIASRDSFDGWQWPRIPGLLRRPGPPRLRAATADKRARRISREAPNNSVHKDVAGLVNAAEGAGALCRSSMPRSSS